jgi:chromosome segregation ATPase
MKRTPTGWVIIGISWSVFLGGIILGGYFYYINSWKLAASAVTIGVILGASLRTLANIGEFLFILQKNSFQALKGVSQIRDIVFNNFTEVKSLLTSLKENLSSIQENITTLNITSMQIKTSLESNAQLSQSLLTSLKENLEKLFEEVCRGEETLHQINSDSKDINQNIYKLSSFLENIEKHLNLKDEGSSS